MRTDTAHDGEELRETTADDGDDEELEIDIEVTATTGPEMNETDEGDTEDDSDQPEGGDGDTEDEAPAGGNDSDLTSVTGIGPAYAERLVAAGVETLPDLARADTDTLADEIDVPVVRVAEWIDIASESSDTTSDTTPASSEGEPEATGDESGRRGEGGGGDSTEATSKETTDSADGGAGESDDTAVTDTDDETTESIPDRPPARFEAKIEAGRLHAVLRALLKTTEEARLVVDEDGLRIGGVDAANVAMDKVFVGAGGFETYDATPGTIGVSLERLDEVVRLGTTKQLVELSFVGGDRSLRVSVDGVCVSIATLTSESIREEPDLPVFDWPTQATAEGAAFRRGVEAAALVSKVVTLSATDGVDVFGLEASGDLDTVVCTLDDDDLAAITPRDATANFSLDYLKPLFQTVPKDAAVTVQIGTDLPLSVSYEFADGEGAFTRLVAPRIG